MHNNHQKTLLDLTKFVTGTVALVVGAGIFFGEIFSWSSGDLWGHLYSFLSILALGLGAGAFLVNKIKPIAQALLVTHLVATIGAWTTSGAELGIAIFLVSIDLALLYLNSRKAHSGTKLVREKLE